MHFFDCNVYVGSPAYQRPLLPVPTAGALLAEMDRAGVKRALVWHIAQHDASPQAGNRLVVEEIRPHERLAGCWAVLPTQTGELAPAPALFRQMREARVCALRIFPSAHKFVANGVSLGAFFGELVDRRIPLFVSVRRGMDWPDVYALLEDFPDLVCVICDHGSWGMDRLFRPLLERYQNVHVDTSQYLLDGGIEDLVAGRAGRGPPAAGGRGADQPGSAPETPAGTPLDVVRPPSGGRRARPPGARGYRA